MYFSMIMLHSYIIIVNIVSTIGVFIRDFIIVFAFMVIKVFMIITNTLIAS